MQYPSGLMTIDLNAIQSNWRHLRAQLIKGAECGAVVKADAYGLGMEPVARALWQAGCRRFFVVNLQEGMTLRRALGVEPTIYVLQGVKPGEEAACVQQQLVPVLINRDMVQRWLAFCEGAGPHTSVLKVNTGMNRLGLELEELQALLENPGILDKLGCDLLMSHLACAEETSHPLNERQRQAFAQVLAQVRRQRPQVRASLANSAATLRGEHWQFDLVRPGISLYGSNPLDPPQHRMQPVVTLQLPVVQTRRVTPGSAVGYGASYVAESERHLVAVGGGYGDGLFRSLGNNGRVWFGRELPMVGRVSMDSLTVDATALPANERPVEGDSIELLGGHLDIDRVAADAGTVAYEVLTRLKGRYQRRYLLDGDILDDGSSF